MVTRKVQFSNCESVANNLLASLRTLQVPSNMTSSYDKSVQLRAVPGSHKTILFYLLNDHITML